MAELSHGYFKLLSKELEEVDQHGLQPKKRKAKKGEDPFLTALLQRLSKHYEFQKGCDSGIDERLARGDLGQCILKKSMNEEFEMFGEDNVLLGQVNPYSVVSNS